MEVALNQLANINFSMERGMRYRFFSYIRESNQQLRG
jgi:hypothetical protein